MKKLIFHNLFKKFITIPPLTISLSATVIINITITTCIVHKYQQKSEEFYLRTFCKSSIHKNYVAYWP